MDRFVLEVPNFFPLELCKEITTAFESVEDTIEPGDLEYYSNGKIIYRSKKPNKEVKLCRNLSFKHLDSKVRKYITKAYKLYLEHLHHEFDHNKKPFPHIFSSILEIKGATDHGYNVHQIKRGGSYEWHIDDVPHIQKSRFVQLIVYLNTLEPNEGGTTEFVNGRKIRPEAGKLLMWPCSWTFPHCGNEVKAKYKYILITHITL